MLLSRVSSKTCSKNTFSLSRHIFRFLLFNLLLFSCLSFSLLSDFSVCLSPFSSLLCGPPVLLWLFCLRMRSWWVERASAGRVRGSVHACWRALTLDLVCVLGLGRFILLMYGCEMSFVLGGAGGCWGECLAASLPSGFQLRFPFRHTLTHSDTHTHLKTHNWVGVTGFAQLLRNYLVTGFWASWDVQFGDAEASLLWWQRDKTPKTVV